MKNSAVSHLDNIAGKYPNNMAIIDKNKNITFSQYREKSRIIATNLCEILMFNQPIAVFINKSIECLEVFMGILYSGNYYCPIPINSPKERTMKIVETLRLTYIITDKANHKKVTQFSNNKLNILLYEDLVKGIVNERLVQMAINRVIDTNPIYVLFTSGSTGVSKGVTVPHRAVSDYIEWSMEEFNIDENSILASQAPFHFDASMPDIFLPLFTGAKLVLFSEKLFMFPTKLVDFLNEKKVNTLIWVPSALMILSSRNLFEKYLLNYIKLVMFCGEVMPNKHLNIWRKYYHNTKFVNLYGPTEAAYACTYYSVMKEFRDDEPLPIGYPCKNTDIILLDKDNIINDANVVGEICIRGSSLALGYYGNTENNAFVQNPSNKKYRDIIYRTGDLGFVNMYGEIMYVGRKDFQIKHMGYRIELGEIEMAASSIECVENVCVIYDSNEDEIILFYVVSDNCEKEKIAKELRSKIPDYMMPNVYWLLDNMPYNLNGKIDRVQLQQLIKTKEKDNCKI